MSGTPSFQASFRNLDRTNNSRLNVKQSMAGPVDVHASSPSPAGVKLRAVEFRRPM